MAVRYQCDRVAVCALLVECRLGGGLQLFRGEALSVAVAVARNCEM
jgi:hypothetical protein